MKDAKYFVTSSGDAPERMFFDLETAKANGSIYIDAFNAEGISVASIKHVDDNWTETF